MDSFCRRRCSLRLFGVGRWVAATVRCFRRACRHCCFRVRLLNRFCRLLALASSSGGALLSSREGARSEQENHAAAPGEPEPDSSIEELGAELRAGAWPRSPRTSWTGCCLAPPIASGRWLSLTTIACRWREAVAGSYNHRTWRSTGYARCTVTGSGLFRTGAAAAQASGNREDEPTD